MKEATAIRIPWSRLPSTARTAVERNLGARVLTAIDQTGGFSHGVAARLLLANGSSAFVKALPDADELAAAYRTEAITAAALPDGTPTPRLRFTIDIDGWFVAGFDDAGGRHPRLDHPNEAADVLATVTRLAEVLTPCPLPAVPTFADAYRSHFGAWARFTDQGTSADIDPWCHANLDQLTATESAMWAATDGNTLLHTDLRPDNMLWRDDNDVLVIDWAWPCRGGAWIDLVVLCPSFLAADVDPDPIIAVHPLTRDLDPTVIDGLICALAGYWTVQCREPAPARSPNLRPYQAEAADRTLAWLRRRL
jgi:hypothetical protein